MINMFKGQNEIRMIWLMILIIVAVSAWFLNVHIVTYVCGVAFVMSVMQYADRLDQSVVNISNKSAVFVQPSSRVPLYVSSIIALLGVMMSWHLVVAAGISAWIFFFLRWLKRIECSLVQVEHKLEHHLLLQNNDQNQISSQTSDLETNTTYQEQDSLTQQIKHWVFQGNPVLKVAIIVLVIGIILLLRFATEHWQLSLSVKLGIIASMSAMISALGYALINKNRSFALALEGLGLAGLFLTIFFAYYNTVLPNIVIAGGCFVGVMAITLWLSLKQQSVELALMAMVIAYIAPFTLPVRDATAVEFITYYLIINIAVAILSTLRPWKFLNQIAFLMTAIVGGGYAFYKGQLLERTTLTFLVFAHAAVFIWLGFRFSQLIAKEDLARFSLKPTLDIALIFSAPIVSYIFIYLMYFDDTFWQAAISLLFAVIFAGLYLLSKKSKNIALISQSYLSLTLIFLALIPPILLPDHWSVVGWAIEGLAIFIFALYKESAISRYLAIGLLIIAGISSIYYLLEANDFPNTMYWVLCVSYFLVVFLANIGEKFQQQLTNATIVFLSLILFFATTLLLVLLQDELYGKLTDVMTLGIASFVYVVINEVLLKRHATWSWLIPKWIGLIPIYIFARILIGGHFENGVLEWESLAERVLFAISGILLTSLWLRPLLGVRAEKEWVSLGVISSLALTSLTLFPNMPFLSVVLLPLVFCVFCYWKIEHSDWQIFWKAKTTLVLTAVWIVTSQLFSQQAFYGYFLPVLNPFDLVSVAILVGFIWMLSLQIKAGLDKGMVAVMMVLSLLWLSSYIVLRALHVYFETPFNEIAIWSDAIVQLSLTMLWVSLAFVTMSIASKKQLRAMWVLGGSILVIVTLKLVLFDLSHIGTLTRVISFLAAGFVMLIIAYIAPMPDEQNLEIKAD